MGKSKGKKSNPAPTAKPEAKATSGNKENKNNVAAPVEKSAADASPASTSTLTPTPVENVADRQQQQPLAPVPITATSPEIKPLEQPPATNNNNNAANSSKPAPKDSPKKEVEKEKAVIVPEKPESAKEGKKPVVTEALNCAVCSKVSASKCGGCNKVAYCSRDHQKAHWKVHKNECILWKIGENKTLGRFLVAARDIKAGKIILQEKPLILTPPKISSPVCLGCYNEILSPDESAQPGDQDLQASPCIHDCGWPMCNSAECKENRKEHDEAECKISLARGKVNIKVFGQDHPMYQAIGVLRALSLQERSPEEFGQLLNLQSNVQAALEEIKKQQEEQGEEGSDQQQIAPQLDFSMAVSLILDYFQQGKKPGVTDELVRKLASIIETNGHEIPLPGNYGQLTRRLIGVYNVTSFLEHNCTPNCVKSFDSGTREIIIRSAVPIKKGEHLSISYVDPLWGTNDRNTFLKMTKFFSCRCKRCLDPTELNCHISSLRCQQVVHANSTTPAMIVPLEPLNPESEWKCLSCEEIYPVKYAASIAERIGMEAEEFQEKRGDIEADEEFLRKYARHLPPNHFFFLELKVELAQLYGRTAGAPLQILSPQKLLRKIQLCEELLRVLNVIVPGYNRLRHLIFYELQAAISTLSKIKHSFGEIPTKIHIEELLKCRFMLIDVVKVLSWEPDLSVEMRRCEGAKKELEDLEALIKTLVELQENLSNAPRSNKVFFSPESTEGPEKATAELDEEELELF